MRCNIHTGGTQHGVHALKCSVSRHLSPSAEPIESWVGELAVARVSRPDAGGLLVDTNLADVTALRSPETAVQARLCQVADVLPDKTPTPDQVRTA